MIDTICFRAGYQQQLPEIIKENFRCLKGRVRQTWALNSEEIKGRKLPQITASYGYGISFVTASVSLPKYVFGNNIEMVNQDQIIEAIPSIFNFVEEKTGLSFNLTNVRVPRVDYCYNWQLESPQQVKAYLQAAKTLTLPYCHTRTYQDTVYIGNNSQATTLYDKGAETLAKAKGNKELIEKSENILRLEQRKLTRLSCEKLAELYNIGNETLKLIKDEIACDTLRRCISELGLNRTILTNSNYFDVLREKFPTNRGFNRAVRFIEAIRIHGEANLVIKGIYSASSYYDTRKFLKKGGLYPFLFSDVPLEPLADFRELALAS